MTFLLFPFSILFFHLFHLLNVRVREKSRRHWRGWRIVRENYFYYFVHQFNELKKIRTKKKSFLINLLSKFQEQQVAVKNEQRQKKHRTTLFIKKFSFTIINDHGDWKRSTWKWTESEKICVMTWRKDYEKRSN